MPGQRWMSPGPLGIPEHFTLIANNSRHPCHVIWRKESGSASPSIKAASVRPAGVEFTPMQIEPGLWKWKLQIDGAVETAPLRRRRTQ